MLPEVKTNLLVTEEMPLSPGEGSCSQSYEIKRTTEKLPWKRDIREVLSMQKPPSKKENVDGGREMRMDGENERRTSDEEEDDQGETSERKEVANGWHKEEVTNLDGAVELWDVKAKLMEWTDTFEGK